MEETIPCRGPCKKIWSKFGRSSFLRHIKQAAKCSEKYTDTEIADLEECNKQRKLNINKERKRTKYDSEERKNKYQKTDKTHELQRQRENYDVETRSKKYQKTDKAPELQRQRENYKSKKLDNEKSSTEKSRLRNFNHEKQYGPIFTCMCCTRDLFRRSVKRITDDYLLFLHGSEMLQFLQTNEIVNENNLFKLLKESLNVHGDYHLCHTCCRSLDKLKMPAMCAKNSLEYAEIPICLQIANLERQLICRDLVFIKVREVGKTRMSKMNDRVINVPMDDDDIIKTVTNLPRTEKNSGMVIVGLKRDLALKKFEKLEMISPDRVYRALLHLKENHPQYKDIKISSLDQWYNQFEENDTVSNSESSENEDTENVKGSEFTNLVLFLKALSNIHVSF